MMDNFDTESSKDNHGRLWNTRRNHLGWRLYLRKDAKKEVSPYAAAARQMDYRNLPPAYTFVGDGEPFYSETLAFIEKLKEAGVTDQDLRKYGIASEIGCLTISEAAKLARVVKSRSRERTATEGERLPILRQEQPSVQEVAKELSRTDERNMSIVERARIKPCKEKEYQRSSDERSNVTKPSPHSAVRKSFTHQMK